MSTDPMSNARAAHSAGKDSLAIDLAWKAVRPAVINQNDDIIRQAMHLGEEVASTATGETRDEAETLASYCAAAIIKPRETNPSPWSMKRLFSWGTGMKLCPDCAESIQADAKVCRFCGYRYGSATQ